MKGEDFLFCLVEKGEKLGLSFGLEDLDAGLAEVGYALEDGGVGKVATNVDDASEFGALALFEFVVVAEAVLYGLLDLAFEDFELPIESHGVIVMACVEVGADVLEEPRLSEGSTTNHHGIYAVAIETFFGSFGSSDVAISDDWDGDARAVLYFADEGPVGFALVHLGAGASVDGKCLDATILEALGKGEDEGGTGGIGGSATAQRGSG